MSEPIQKVATGCAPYGLEQFSYVLPSAPETGLAFDALIAQVGLHRSATLEAALAAQIEAINQRREKLDCLGWSLAYCSTVMQEQSGKKTKTGTMLYEAGFNTIVQHLQTYDTPEVGRFTYDSDKRCYGISYGDLQLEYEDLAYAIDRENATLQQELIDLQSLIAKRDSSFEQAATLSGKVRTSTERLLEHL